MPAISSMRWWRMGTSSGPSLPVTAMHPRRPVEDQLATGRPVLLEIELEGARQVRRSFPDGFQIFWLHPVSTSSNDASAAGVRIRRKRSVAGWLGLRTN